MALRFSWPSAIRLSLKVNLDREKKIQKEEGVHLNKLQNQAG